MYLIDTDVLSNLVKRSPSHDLLKRVGSVPVGSQFTSSITLGELVYGSNRRRWLSRCTHSRVAGSARSRVFPTTGRVFH